MSERRGWPPILCEIADCIGDAAAMQLVAALGGQEVYIAKEPHAEQDVSRTIGIDAARLLAVRFGGLTLPVPTAWYLRSAKRRILAALAKGETGTNRLAAAEGVSARHVRAIKALLPADDEQLNLFD